MYVNDNRQSGCKGKTLSTVRRVDLRIFANVNEHYGQSVANARVNGIVPSWSPTELQPRSETER
jgi:hypothetical protein